MLKSFYNHYKKKTVTKYFYESKVHERSTAYGQTVADDFVAWCKYFDKTWNTRGTNFLLCEQGNIDGNPIRGDVRYGSARRLDSSSYRVKQTQSFLAPLYLRDKFFEVDTNGYVYANGQKQLDAGKELKAWAIMSYLENDIPVESLLVIGKPAGANDMYLAAYAIGDTVNSKPYATVKLCTTLSAQSSVVCFGRHVFVAHDSKLNYFYYSPQTKCFENVPIGNFLDNSDKEYCKLVGKQFVTDGSRVYWMASEDVYSIQIGYPHRVVKFDLEKSSKTFRLQCFDQALYAYRQLNGRYECIRYRIGVDGYTQNMFNSNSKMHVFVSNNKGSARVFRIAGDENSLTDITITNDETVKSKFTLNSTDRLFCLDTGVAEARYLAYDKSGEILAIN